MAFLTWEFLFGLLGNIISCLVCLAPLPTFYQICKKKTSEGYQSIPYVVALFSAMLWLFYAIFQAGSMLLITINSFTFFMEIGYILVYLIYATKEDKIFTSKLVLLFNVFGFGSICVLTLFLTQGEKRVQVLGWICMIFALCVFVAPLGIVVSEKHHQFIYRLQKLPSGLTVTLLLMLILALQRKVIKTKSVEFMPFSLSFFLTLSAVMWFFYGYLKKDLFVAIPNILGFIFGLLQMVLYMIYRKGNKAEAGKKINELPDHIVDIEKLSAAICTTELHAVNVPAELCNNGNKCCDDDEPIAKGGTNPPCPTN